MDFTEHTILVAFTVYAPTWEQAQARLMRQLPSPDHPGVDGIDSWWIAEDERYDGSDNDSAVLVPMGRQAFFQGEVSVISNEEDGR